MKRRAILIAAGFALLAILCTGFFCWRMAWPRLRQAFEGTTVDVAPPPVEVGVRPGEPRQPRQAPPVEEIVGIGAMLRFDNDTGQLVVMNTIPGSPAERAGLREGMLIQKVNDTLLAGVPLAECIALIRGPVGSKVRLEVLDPQKNAVIPVELIRERVQLGGQR
jgi:S1-C subfamily serine protease